MKKIFYIMLPVLMFAASASFAQNAIKKDLPEIKTLSKEDRAKLEKIKEETVNVKMEKINGEVFIKNPANRDSLKDITEINFNQRVSLSSLNENPKDNFFKLNLGKDKKYALTNLRLIKENVSTWTWGNFLGMYLYKFEFHLIPTDAEQILIIKITPAINNAYLLDNGQPEPTRPYAFVEFKKEDNQIFMTGSVYPIDASEGRSMETLIMEALEK